MAYVESNDYVPSDNEEENIEISPSKVGKYGTHHVFGRKKYGKNVAALEAARDKRRSALLRYQRIHHAIRSDLARM